MLKYEIEPNRQSDKPKRAARPRVSAIMMQRAALLFVMLLASVQAHAQSFQGRNYLLIDGRSTAGPAPMVVLLHGSLGTGAQVARDARFAGLTRDFGIVTVAPNGLDRRWVDGRYGPNDSSDVSYLGALIEDLIARGIADPARIYAIGHSNGGGMAMRMACDRPDLISGIGVIATKVVARYPCGNGTPVPAIFFHGTADRLSPHEGRPVDAPWGETLSSDESMALWSSRNRCARAGQPLRVDNRPGDGTALMIETYQGCAAALSRVLIENGGHGWPGSRQGPIIGGRVTREIDAGRASLRFLLR